MPSLGRFRIRPRSIKKQSMTLFDIHTHNDRADGKYTIYNSNGYIEDRKISIGIHPWDINDGWEERFAAIRNEACRDNVRAVGECGIDKLRSVATIETQLKVFKAHAMLAEEIQKPLIIHCVKGLDEITAIHKEIAPKQAWIIHGFRGKPQQAEQLAKNGFYISFGEMFNAESLKTTPKERLFIESDESQASINEIYRRIAEALDCTIEELATTIMQNAEKISVLTI